MVKFPAKDIPHSLKGNLINPNRPAPARHLVDIKKPVVLIIFNRAETTRRVFEAIERYGPQRLFIIADGSRPARAGEYEACQLTRDAVSSIPWECEVTRIYSDVNMGCRLRIQSGLDEVFKQVESAIILEDDCLPDDSFFDFASQMLDEFQDEPRVGMVSGNNFQLQFRRHTSNYYFSSLPHIWGWATWSSRWAMYERNAETWNSSNKSKLLKKVFLYRVYRKAWMQTLNSISSIDTWDYQWAYTMWAHDMYSIVPGVNLVQNIGLNESGTNTLSAASHFQNRRGTFEGRNRHGVRALRRSKFKDFLELTIFRIFAARHMNLEEWKKKALKALRRS